MEGYLSCTNRPNRATTIEDTMHWDRVMKSGAFNWREEGRGGEGKERGGEGKGGEGRGGEGEGKGGEGRGKVRQ